MEPAHTHTLTHSGADTGRVGGGSKLVCFSPVSSILVGNYNLRNIFRALYLIEEEKDPT